VNPLLSRDWPSPGVLWGAYPHRVAGKEHADRRPAWGRLRLRAFAHDPLRTDDPASMAVARACEAMAASTGLAPRWQQRMAARALLDQRLVEMDTGEGKTVVLAVAAAAAALLGSPVQVVTANDYLAERDAVRLRPFFAALGLRCAAVTGAMHPGQRIAAYAAHVTYVAGRELAFDVLRDDQAAPAAGSLLAARLPGMRPAGARLLPGLCVALLDEADAVLVDEARTPIVLAEPEDAGERRFLQEAFTRAGRLREGEHFRVAAHDGRVRLLDEAQPWLEGDWGPDDALHRHPLHRREAVALALQARHVLQAGRDYLVTGGRIELVDPVTGRTSPGRTWSRGLHQLVEIKEGLEPSVRTRTVAQTTYQQLFNRYLRVAGISGTLREAAAELRQTYGLVVLRVPRHAPSRVVRHASRMHADSRALWRAAALRVRELAAAGRPVLVGVNTVAQCAAVSAALREAGVPHEVLDAARGEHESRIVEAAGRSGQVTVATSIAGRGSDILLDEAARRAGGLHVLLCQWNRSARVDRQFFGRAGRQGEPGSCEHWLAADFDAFRGPVLGAAASVLHRWRWGPAVRVVVALAQRLAAWADSTHRVTMARAVEAQAQAFDFTRERLL
jgi:preprotein translocase subunit SecA